MTDDKRLNGLVREALVNNPDLCATACRLNAENYLLNGLRSRLFQRLNTEFSKGRDNQNVDVQTGVRRTTDAHRLSLGVSWEIDLWGRLADEYASSKYSLAASKEDYLRARDALAARVIQIWIEQVANRRAVSIASDRVAVLEHKEQEMLVKMRLNEVKSQQLSNRVDLALALGVGVNDG